MVKPKPTISKLNNYPSELTDVAQLEQEARGAAGTADHLLWTRGDYREYLGKSQKPSGVAQVAVLGGKVVGVLAFKAIRKQELVEIEHLLIHPGFRRQGVGRHMVDGLVDAADKKKKKVFVQVPERSFELVEFFSALGFRAKSVTSGHFGHDEDAYYMVS